jgi:hypothetical protein
MAKKKEYMTKEQLYDAHKLIKKLMLLMELEKESFLS